MSELDLADVLLLVVASVCVGFAKTAIGGVAAVSVALFAAVLPARESTGALLPLLMAGDLVAVIIYRQHADWPALLRLFPSVAVGVVVGALFVARVSDLGMRRTIGVVLLVLVAVHVVQRWRRGTEPGVVQAEQGRRRHAPTIAFGVLAGFTTMVANSGGAVMSIYLLSAGLGMLGFLGTTAWFFLLVNLFKMPFSIALDLVTFDSLLLNAWLLPAVLVGAWLGRIVIHRIAQERFESLVLVFVVLSSLNLVR